MSDEIRLETLVDQISHAPKRASELLFDAYIIGRLGPPRDVADTIRGLRACKAIEEESLDSYKDWNFKEAAHHQRRAAYIAKHVFHDPYNELTQKCNSMAADLDRLDNIYKEQKPGREQERQFFLAPPDKLSNGIDNQKPPGQTLVGATAALGVALTGLTALHMFPASGGIRLLSYGMAAVGTVSLAKTASDSLKTFTSSRSKRVKTTTVLR